MRLLLIMLISFLTSNAFANEFGVGGILGSPTGISLSYNLGNNHSLAGAVAYSFSQYSGFHIHGDYLWDNQRQFKAGTWDWSLYYGVGARIVNAKYDETYKAFLAARAPFGVVHRLKDPNIMLFGEIAPGINLIPRTDIIFDIGVGARFLF